MCGPVDIDGSVFCSGLNRLKLSNKGYPDFENRIRSVAYLIKRAPFQPKYGHASSNRHSIGELMDMYHAHKATKLHDKIYALLNMSFDSPDELLPDYELPWDVLFRRLVKHILFQEVEVGTWQDREVAVIKSKGYCLGRVEGVEYDDVQHDIQHVDIVCNQAAGILGLKTPKYKATSDIPYWNQAGAFATKWTLQASAKPIQKGDILCLLHGASKPCIIRAGENCFDIIMIAVSPQYDDSRETLDLRDQAYSALIGVPPRNLLLLWNWQTGGEQRKANESATKDR
ncbi:hypothetical protein AWENTII_009508 [Aspergillus wentii]